jgi:hypothetical protein
MMQRGQSVSNKEWSLIGVAQEKARVFRTVRKALATVEPFLDQLQQRQYEHAEFTPGAWAARN